EMLSLLIPSLKSVSVIQTESIHECSFYHKAYHKGGEKSSYVQAFSHRMAMKNLRAITTKSSFCTEVSFLYN
ncbi:MAG: hypothetical protein PUB00_00780, partial [Clostridiales bacterium]|nr:hypothetical protein [Clostridiales bacterium]